MAEKAFLFTQQTIGLGARKTSMIFLAEAYRDLGYEVHVVTCQLSKLTHLKRPNKLQDIDSAKLNNWYDADGMRGYIWVPIVHPASLGGRLDPLSGPLLIGLYSLTLPSEVRDLLEEAKLILIESCAAVALFRTIRAIAGKALIVYSMSDRLVPNGMLRALQRRLEEDSTEYSLVRVPARAMLSDLPNARTAFIPHGLQTDLFSGFHPSPFDRGQNAVLVGDMMLDKHVLTALLAAFPAVQFHYFGRTRLDMGIHANLREYGEVAFETLIPYLKNADVGLSLYRRVTDLDYLAESSLKNIQYRYCGLPIVAPDFVARDNPRAFAYETGDPTSAAEALRAAFRAGRLPVGSEEVLTWDQVARQVLAAAQGRVGGYRP